MFERNPEPKAIVSCTNNAFTINLPYAYARSIPFTKDDQVIIEKGISREAVTMQEAFEYFLRNTGPGLGQVGMCFTND